MVGVLAGIHGVVDSVARDLSVGLLWLIPLDERCGGAHHVTSDLPRCGAGCLLSSFGLNALAGWPSADVVYRHHPKLIVGVGAEAPDAVPSGGYAINLFVQLIRVLGLVLDDVVGNWFRVARVPSQCYACGCALFHYRNTRSLGQRCDDNYRMNINKNAKHTKVTYW